MFLPTKLKQGPQGTKLLQDYKKGGVQQAKQLTGTVAAFPAGAPGAAAAGVGVGVGVGSDVPENTLTTCSLSSWTSDNA